MLCCLQALTRAVEALRAASVESQELVLSQGAAIGVLQQGLASLRDDVHQDREVPVPSHLQRTPVRALLLLLFAHSIHMTTHCGRTESASLGPHRDLLT